MQKYKLRNASIFIAIYLIINWLLMELKDILTTRKFLGSMPQLAFLKDFFQSYSSLSPDSICTISTLVFLFMYVYIQRYVKSTQIIRVTKRENLIIENSKDIVLLSVIYTVIAYLIHFIGLFFMFDKQNILESKMIYYGLINLPILFLFLVKTGLLNNIFGNLLGRKISPFIVFTIHAIEIYFLKNLFKWLPCYDSSIYQELLSGQISKNHIYQVYIRLFAFIVAFYIINLFIILHKDYLNDEK